MKDLAKVILASGIMFGSIAGLSELRNLFYTIKQMPDSRYELFDSNFDNDNVPEIAISYSGAPTHGVFPVYRPVNQEEIEYFAKH